jgi:hypothetical protein
MPVRLSDIINVKDWGAFGDAFSNDGPAIQAAINYAIGPRPDGSVGGTVFFPAGNYVIGGSVLTCGSSSPTPKVNLVGVAQEAVRINATIWKGASNAYDCINRIESMSVLSGIVLYGDQASVENVFTSSIDTSRASNVYIGTVSFGGGGGGNPSYTPPHGPPAGQAACYLGDSCVAHNCRGDGGSGIGFALSGYGPSVQGSGQETSAIGTKVGWAPSFTLNTSASTASGSKILTFAAVTNGKGFVIGRVLTHANLPAGTTIASVDTVAGTVTLSAAATGTIASNQPIVFTSDCPAIGFTVSNMEHEACDVTIDLYNCDSGIVTSCVLQGQVGSDSSSAPALITGVSWSAGGFFGAYGGTATVTTAVNHNIPTGLNILQLYAGTVLGVGGGFIPPTYNGKGNIGLIVAHVTTSASTSFEYFLAADPGPYTANWLRWLYPQTYAMRCRKVHNTYIGNISIGKVNAAYASLDLDYNGEAQHSNNVFGPCGTDYGIQLPIANKQNLAGWKFMGVYGAVNFLEGIAGWTGYNGQATVANADGNMRFADLPGNYTAQPYYQVGPIDGQEYLIKDANIAASGNWNAAVTAGGSSNKVKVRYDPTGTPGWKISG